MRSAVLPESLDQTFRSARTYNGHLQRWFRKPPIQFFRAIRSFHLRKQGILLNDGN
jgi:hypothetical protein